MLEILLSLFRYGFLLALFYFVYKVVSLICQDLKATVAKNTAVSSEGLFYSLEEPEYTSHSKLENLEKEFSLLLPMTTIGRGTHNHLVIDDTYTSYEHARIVYQDERFYLEDLESTNGTYLNGVRIKERVELQENDQVKIGETSLVFRR